MTQPADAVVAEGISKCYHIYDHPRDRLLQAFWGSTRQLYRPFWALQEVSFRLARGQTLGVVGRNGSGKSTLLQLLCGTLTPTSGTVQVRGRLGALLELGSGFNPEFSGLENVYLNASVLGLSRVETDERLDRILGFADIGDFLNQPVKTYSSGMAVRLAFAVQAHVDPDVLVVDEALAVGDELFQKKCYAHLERLKENGTSVLLVTHSCPQILQHCDRALLLHKGRARRLDEPARITVLYQRLITASDAEWDAVLAPPLAQTLQAATAKPNTENAFETTGLPKAAGLIDNTDATIANPEPESGPGPLEAWFDASLQPQSTEVYPSHGARITEAWFETLEGQRANVLPFGEGFALCFDYAADTDLEGVCFACHLASHTGQRISGQMYPEHPNQPSLSGSTSYPTGHHWSLRFSFQGGLWPGLYFAGGGILTHHRQGRSFIHRVVDYRALRVVEAEQVQVIGACSLQLAPPELMTDEPVRPSEASSLHAP
ncbi:ABC transporter ATP-binding protein [Synechococcus sp. CS-1328]|uniref:ABC transporter ATP-binding protein n=1 Tax=Synechococcus sp. CS-1328 TaxID=2847976 RepID=UPI00223C48F0|nr:ATP-binding cassette domain-containing protein [Synechococcus sp. CS-1328]MCT0224989.1 ATP-binding cassette domain-containing protein [Synechococcus sp. CS-1328]